MKECDYPKIDFSSSELQQLVEDDHCVRCPICDKVFYVPYVRDWTYKLNNNEGKGRILCSYTCYTKANKIKKSFMKYDVKNY